MEVVDGGAPALEIDGDGALLSLQRALGELLAKGCCCLGGKHVFAALPHYAAADLGFDVFETDGHG